MEDPLSEIESVIERLTQNDDIELQQSTVYSFFAPDAVLDTQAAYAKGVSEIASVYKVWALLHQDVGLKVQRVLKGEEVDTLVVQGILCERPWFNPFFQRKLPSITLFRLEDYPKDSANGNQQDGDGANGDSKPLKRIVLQKSFFIHNYMWANLPVIGPLYIGPFFRELFAKATFVIVSTLEATVGTNWIGNVTSSVCQVAGG